MPELFFYGPDHRPGNIQNAQADGFAVKEAVYHKYESGLPAKGWLYLNDTPRNNRHVVLFLHGNSYNVEHYYHKTVPLAEAGYSVFIPEYRGFGGQGYKIRQAMLEEDAVNAVRYLNRLGFDNENIVVYGMSLGSHMALHAVFHEQQREKFDSLVLEVPFTSLADVAEKHVSFMNIPLLPLDLLIRDKYNNLDMVDKIDTRILVMTTESDSLIPPAQARTLYERARKPKKLVVYQGAGHDSLYNLRNYREILDWLGYS